MKIVQFPGTQASPKPDFEEFYRSYYNRVLHYISGKIGCGADAEDLTSEIFVYCWNHYDSYDPEKSALATWTFLVANSRLKNYYRDRKDHADITEFENYLYSEGTEMERAVYLEQLSKRLREVLAELPERQRRVVEERYFHERSHEEIAALLGTTPGNVRVILSRALDRLGPACADLMD